MRDPRAEHMRRVWRQVDFRIVIRDAHNPFELSTTEFRKLYRMSQHVFFNLVGVLEPMCPVRFHHNAVPLPIRVRATFYHLHVGILFTLTERFFPHLQILCAVGFYASGSYQRIFGRGVDVCVSQASVSNFITEVTQALNRPEIMSRYIHFPENPAEREEVIRR